MGKRGGHFVVNKCLRYLHSKIKENSYVCKMFIFYFEQYDNIEL